MTTEQTPLGNTNRPLKVGITGTHYAGKSTLADGLALALNIPVLCGVKTLQSAPTEVARELGYQRSSLVTKEDREMFQWLCVFRQREFESRHPSFVSGRTAIEFNAYWQLELGGAHNATYEKVCRHLIRNYDLIIYLEMNSASPEDNGQRYLDGTEAIDRHVWAACENWIDPDKLYHMSANTPDGRVREAIGALQQKGLL